MTKAKQEKQNQGKAKVLLVDDHPVVRLGLAQLINMQDDLAVCADAADGREALQAADRTKPDVAIVDISLDKDMGGIELIKDLKTHHPKLPVLALSMYDEAIFAERALRAGAKGYIMKEAETPTLLAAIRQVLQGEIWLSHKMASIMLSGVVNSKPTQNKFPTDQLTDRELEVLQLIGRGMGTSQIAEKLHLSVKTIETYRGRIKEKLQLDTAGELTEFAIQWVSKNIS